MCVPFARFSRLLSLIEFTRVMMSAETGSEASTSALENTRENVVDQASSLDVSAPLRGSYASATRGNNVELTRNDNPDPENTLPSRPFTVYFHPRYYVPSHDVFDALRQADIDAQAVSCIARAMVLLS